MLPEVLAAIFSHETDCLPKILVLRIGNTLFLPVLKCFFTTFPIQKNVSSNDHPLAALEPIAALIAVLDHDEVLRIAWVGTVPVLVFEPCR